MSERLLIVEDTKVFAHMLKSLVWQQHGISADIVESYADAKSILSSKGSDTYFAAIVDLHLPDAPNGEAIDLIVAAGIPSIVFTGTADEATEEDLWGKNISDYAHKSTSYGVEYVVWMTKRLLVNTEKHILVVDDSLVARKSMTKLLITQRFNVITAKSGEEALEILSSTPQLDIAIIDWNMDGMNGFELTNRIRTQYANELIEIIGISSHGGRSNSARFIKSGADDFLLKPFIPEEFLCRVNRAAERIDQLQNLKQLNEIKNQFLSTAAHDLRGPLSAIHNAAALLQKKEWPTERKMKMLKMIETNSEDLQVLLNELLDYSVIESGSVKLNCEEVDIADIVNERIELYRAEAEAKSLQIDLDVVTSLPIKLDRIKVQQVIDNLLTNAIKYSPIKGAIIVQVAHTNDIFQLKVIDQGPGVPLPEQEKLFTPYQVLSTQSTAGEKQTGLGLAIAKNIIEGHGGRISYEDASPHGAVFCVSLPINNACHSSIKIR